jgi:hypothetical protein
LQALDEIDQVESELQLLRISKLSMWMKFAKTFQEFGPHSFRTLPPTQTIVQTLRKNRSKERCHPYAITGETHLNFLP